MDKIEVTIEIDTSRLAQYSKSHLAALWHVAQANPAPYGDRTAGDVVEQIGREIIRRWLSTQPPEVWKHQGRDYFWAELQKLGKWNKDLEFVPNDPSQTTSADESREP